MSSPGFFEQKASFIALEETMEETMEETDESGFSSYTANCDQSLALTSKRMTGLLCNYCLHKVGENRRAKPIMASKRIFKKLINGRKAKPQAAGSG